MVMWPPFKTVGDHETEQTKTNMSALYDIFLDLSDVFLTLTTVHNFTLHYTELQTLLFTTLHYTALLSTTLH